MERNHVVAFFIFRFIRAIFKMGETKKKFLHTPHDS